MLLLACAGHWTPPVEKLYSCNHTQHIAAATATVAICVCDMPEIIVFRIIYTRKDEAELKNENKKQNNMELWVEHTWCDGTNFSICNHTIYKYLLFEVDEERWRRTLAKTAYIFHTSKRILHTARRRWPCVAAINTICLSFEWDARNEPKIEAHPGQYYTFEECWLNRK